MPSRRFDWGWAARTFLLRKGDVAGVFVATLVIYAMAASVPILMQQAIDSIIGKTASVGLVWLGAAALLAVVGEASFSALRQRFLIRLAELFDRRVYRVMSLHLLRARLDAERLSPGETLNRLGQIQRIRGFMLSTVPPLSLDAGSSLVALGIMAYYDWTISLVSASIASALGVMLARQRKQARRATRALQTVEGERQAVVAETITEMATIKAQAMEGARFVRWAALTENAIAAFRVVNRLSRRFQVGSQAASRALAVVVLCIGCYRVFHNQLTVGELLAMQLLAARVMAPVLSASQAYAQYQEADVGIAHLADILTAPIERSTGVPPRQRLGSAGLEAENLTLFYPGNPVPALKDVTFAFPAYGLFAIVGRNGSGKSSLVRTFLGLQRDFQGIARVAGHDVLDYTPRWLRRQFGIVNQDSALFIGTVRENVTSGLDGDDSRVWRALDASGARRFVEALPNGLDTVIQEGARNLSGGQRQRLIVARALYRDPPFLILDEPTAFLDPEAALALERNLAALGKDRLVLLVTHHLTATMDADRILVMDEGRVVGEGTHEDLLTSCLTYATLWDDYHRSNRDASHSLSPLAGRGSG